MTADHSTPDTASRGRVFVVFNPVKVGDEQAFRSQTEQAAKRNGWPAPEFLPTTSDDPGHAMVRQAIEQDAKLVLVAGGDGTARVVSTGLAHTEIPCAIIPMGTGNLLARNLNIPLDLVGALDVAFSGRVIPFDLAQVVVDHDEENPTKFTGMAGVGFDAAMMRDTDERLKKVVKNVAYVVAFAKHMAATPRRVRVEIDGRIVLRRRAVLMIVGNTSTLQGGIALFPDAKPDDGQLDLMLAAPTSIGTWARLVGAIMRRLRRSKAVDYRTGTRFELTLDESTPWEIDGDTEGEGRHFIFTVDPGALLVVAGPE